MDVQFKKEFIEILNETLDKRLEEKFSEGFEVLSKKLDEQFETGYDLLSKKIDQQFEVGYDKLSKKLDEQFEEKFIEWFNKGFNEVVLFHIDRLDTGLDKVVSECKFLANRLETVESRLGVVDRKSDQTLDKIITFEGDLKDIKKELKIIRGGLESASKNQVVDKKALKGLEKRLEVLEKISVPA
jgi:hypothetical protein